MVSYRLIAKSLLENIVSYPYLCCAFMDIRYDTIETLAKVDFALPEGPKMSTFSPLTISTDIFKRRFCCIILK